MCPDLVGAVVIEHRLADHELAKNCYRLVNISDGVDACMELNLTTRTCTIYYPKNPSKEVWLHEQAHCRGWEHRRRFMGFDVHYLWSPMRELGLVHGHAVGGEAAKEGA